MYPGVSVGKDVVNYQTRRLYLYLCQIENALPRLKELKHSCIAAGHIKALSSKQRRADNVSARLLPRQNSLAR